MRQTGNKSSNSVTGRSVVVSQPFYGFRLNLVGLKVKVKVTLVQASNSQSGSRCIALLFLLPRRKMQVCGQRHAPAALPTGRKPGKQCKGGWMGLTAGLHGCGKYRHRPGPSSPQRVTIPTELSRPLNLVGLLTENVHHKMYAKFWFVSVRLVLIYIFRPKKIITLTSKGVYK